MKLFSKKSGQKALRKFSRLSEDAVISSEAHIKKNFLRRLSHISDVRLFVLEWGLLVFALFMLALTQSFWFNDSYSTTGFTNGGTYTEATLGKVNSLNPLFATTNSEKTLSELMFLTLTAPDSSGHFGNVLAEYVKSDSSARTWTVKLRDGLKWSDGEPITPEDVLFTTDLISGLGQVSSYYSNLYNVKVSINENNEIVFDLPAIYAEFNTALDFPILPKHALKDADSMTLLESSFSTNPISSGPFSYNAQQSIGVNGESIVYLVANKNYYKGITKIDNFVVHAYLTTDDIKNAIKNGAVSATAELLPTDSEEITSRNLYEKQTAINSGVYLFMNTKSGVFKNRETRQAVQTGIDVSEIRSLVGDEHPLDYPILKNQIALDEWPSLPAKNVEAAKNTISDLEKKTIRLVTISTGYFPVILEDVAEQLENLGFEVIRVIEDPGQDFLVNVIASRNYDMLIYEIELGANPDLLVYYHSSQASQTGLNLSNYSNSVADDLIISARETVEEDVRTQKYESFVSRWIEDAPAIGLYQVNMSYYFDKNVKPFSEDISLIVATDRFSDIRFWGVEKVAKNRTP